MTDRVLTTSMVCVYSAVPVCRSICSYTAIYGRYALRLFLSLLVRYRIEAVAISDKSFDEPLNDFFQRSTDEQKRHATHLRHFTKASHTSRVPIYAQTTNVLRVNCDLFGSKQLPYTDLAFSRNHDVFNVSGAYLHVRPRYRSTFLNILPYILSVLIAEKRFDGVLFRFSFVNVLSYQGEQLPKQIVSFRH